MSDYKVHYDEYQGYWVGKVARNERGQAMFIQQVGNYFQYKKVAERFLQRLIKAN